MQGRGLAEVRSRIAELLLGRGQSASRDDRAGPRVGGAGGRGGAGREGGGTRQRYTQQQVEIEQDEEDQYQRVGWQQKKEAAGYISEALRRPVDPNHY